MKKNKCALCDCSGMVLYVMDPDAKVKEYKWFCLLHEYEEQDGIMEFVTDSVAVLEMQLFPFKSEDM